MEKFNRYFKRTVEHIHRVQNNAVFLVLKCRNDLELSAEECRAFIYDIMKHDQSKFSEKQFSPYIELTEYYHQKRNVNPNYDYPVGIRELVDAAVTDHYCSENHHPERFKGTIGKFSKLMALETVCDLQAMAQEFNEGTCRNYYENVWKKKQSQFFYDDFNWEEVKHWMEKAVRCFELQVETTTQTSNKNEGN